MQFIITSVLAFVSTNIDDIFLLTLFFGNGRFGFSQIIAGQLLGIATLIGISLVLSIAGLMIGEGYISLLGLVPVYLGVKGMIEFFKGRSYREAELTIDEGSVRNSNLLVVSGLTIANGGDNIGIYTPLFATVDPPEKITMIVVFLLMTIAWCLLARYLTGRPAIARIIDTYGHVLTPLVLVLLGIYILYEGDVIKLISRWL